MLGLKSPNKEKKLLNVRKMNCAQNKENAPDILPFTCSKYTTVTISRGFMSISTIYEKHKLSLSS